MITPIYCLASAGSWTVVNDVTLVAGADLLEAFITQRHTGHGSATWSMRYLNIPSQKPNITALWGVNSAKRPRERFDSIVNQSRCRRWCTQIPAVTDPGAHPTGAEACNVLYIDHGARGDYHTGRAQMLQYGATCQESGQEKPPVVLI